MRVSILGLDRSTQGRKGVGFRVRGSRTVQSCGRNRAWELGRTAKLIDYRLGILHMGLNCSLKDTLSI